MEAETMPTFECSEGAKITVALARIEDGQTAVRTDILGVKEEVRLLKEEAKRQNGALSEMKLDAARLTGVASEKQRWEEKAALNLKWWFGAGLVAAGTLSGMVFGILQAIAK